MKRGALAREDGAKRATTLGDLAAKGVDVFCWCNRCSHNATVATAVLLSQFGPDQPVPSIGVRLRCTGCGSKDVAARPAWPSLGPVARHG